MMNFHFFLEETIPTLLCSNENNNSVHRKCLCILLICIFIFHKILWQYIKITICVLCIFMLIVLRLLSKLPESFVSWVSCALCVMCEVADYCRAHIESGSYMILSQWDAALGRTELMCVCWEPSWYLLFHVMNHVSGECTTKQSRVCVFVCVRGSIWTKACWVLLSHQVWNGLFN